MTCTEYLVHNYLVHPTSLFVICYFCYFWFFFKREKNIV